MSTKTLMAIVAAVVVILALPLLPRTFIKPTPEHRTENPSENAAVKKDAAEALPATSGPIPTTKVPAPAAPTPVPVTAQPVPPTPSVMTQAQFNQIRSGMTYEQCVQLIGCEGKLVGTAGSEEEEFTWQVFDDPSSATASRKALLKFHKGVLYGIGFNSNQGQSAPMATIMAGLPAQMPEAPPYINRAVYEGLRDGSTYEECVRLLGMEGTYLGKRTLAAGTYAANGTFVPATADVYTWNNPANRATLTLFFRDGRLSGREMAAGR